jgi:hypothetical protein
VVQDRAREVQRVPKVLEIAGIKLESVVSDVMGKAARRMIDALVAGERDVEAMAEMRAPRMRPTISELQLALEGRFDDHHVSMLSLHLGHVDHLTATIARLDEEVPGGRKAAHVDAELSDHDLSKPVGRSPGWRTQLDLFRVSGTHPPVTPTSPPRSGGSRGEWANATKAKRSLPSRTR